MATTPPAIQTQVTPDPIKFPLAQLFIIVTLGMFVGVSALGGGLYYLLRSGKLPIQSGALPVPSAVESKTHTVTLEPVLVNLADRSGNGYLRIALALRIADASPSKGRVEAESKGSDKAPDAALRDTVLMVLGRQTSDVLLTVDGKEQLKKELKEAISEHNPETRAIDLFFTEFLVQR
jgi:flagellar FliL protein